LSQCHAPKSGVSFVTGWWLLVCALSGHCLAASDYMASSPTPTHGFKTIDPSNVLLTWIPARKAAQQQLYLGTDPILTASDRAATLTGRVSSYFYNPGFELGQTYYWRIDTLDTSGINHTGNAWTFTTLSYQATQPNPTQGSQWVVAQNATLIWQSGLFSVSHDVYFSTQMEAVSLGFSSAYLGLVVGTGQLQYALPVLEKGTTYYWRIDERQSSGVVTQGDVWQFKTLVSDGGIQGRYFDNTYLGESPALTRIDKNVNLNFPQDNVLVRVLASDQFSVRWTGQLFLPQSNDITLSVIANDKVRLRVDGHILIDDWTLHPTRHLNAALTPGQGTSSDIVLEYAHIQGTPHCQLFWSYDGQVSQVIPCGPLQPQTQSHLPSPADLSQNICQSPKLFWHAGTTAMTHDVYLGTSLLSVLQAQSGDPEYLGRQENTSYDLTSLDLNQTYFWCVNDVLVPQTNVEEGPIWAFTTANYYVIDNFESYENAPGQRIFETWIDGLGFVSPLPGHLGNGTGATVGHIAPPYAEQGIVHAGSQSMPLAYNNHGNYQRSEARLTFDQPLNMTQHSNRPLKTLSLAFHGHPVSMGQFTKQQNTFTLTGAGTGFWEENDRCYFVSQSVSGSASISARINSIERIHALSQAGIMIRQSNEPDVPQACVAITADGRLACHYRNSPGQPAMSLYSEPDTVTLPHWIKLQRQGATLSLYHSSDGFAWWPVNLIGQPTMSMAGFASMGLMHCTYRDNLTTATAVFSRVTSTSVTPLNTTSSLGIPLNDADHLYLRLEDTTGSPPLIVPHPNNPQAIQRGAWQTWNINLASLSGINLSTLQTLAIGVGDPNNLQSGGTGLIFIDDISLHP